MKTEDVEYECSDCHSTVPADAKVCPNCGSQLQISSPGATEPTISDEETANQLTAFVMEEIKKGTDDFSISQKLVGMGVDHSNASQVVERIHAEAIRVAEEEQITASSYTPALIGAVLASVIGGIVWGLIVITTNHEIGFMAWGMGWLAGFAVVKLSSGKKGLPFQIIAVTSSLVGITIGKYFTFEHFLKAEVLKEYGTDAASSVTLLSGNVFGIFISNITSMLSGYDALWVLFAVVTAWKIPRGIGIRQQA